MKKEYEIEIEEILQKVVTVEAESLEEAIDVAREKYGNCEIILEAEDLKETSFELYEDIIVKNKKSKNFER